MAITRWMPHTVPSSVVRDPFESQVNRLFDEAFESFWRPAGRRFGSWAQAERWWTPRFNVYEDQDYFWVEAELPGMEMKDIDISVKGHLLTVTGERKAPEGESRTYHLCETGYGSFTRSFTLPEWVDADKAHADYRHGILYIQAPKREESKPRMIPIQATES